MDIFVAAIAGGVMGGIVSVIFTLGLLRRDRRVRENEERAPSGRSESAGLWRAPRGALLDRFARRSRPTPTSGAESPGPEQESRG